MTLECKRLECKRLEYLKRLERIRLEIYRELTIPQEYIQYKGIGLVWIKSEKGKATDNPSYIYTNFESISKYSNVKD